jgi:hypothetical protein
VECLERGHGRSVDEVDVYGEAKWMGESGGVVDRYQYQHWIRIAAYLGTF